MKWFSFIYFKDRRIQNTLDAIRLLANPHEKLSAHITLRGPYLKDQHQNLKETIDIEGTTIHVYGIDNFFKHRQNTVFLKCDSLYIKKYWMKKDYPYNPHISLYDGKSSELAFKLFNSLRMHRFYFPLSAGRVVHVPSSGGQGGFLTWFDIDSVDIQRIIGQKFSIEHAQNLEDWERIAYIDRLATHLIWYAQSCSSNLSARGPAQIGKLDLHEQ